MRVRRGVGGPERRDSRKAVGRGATIVFAMNELVSVPRNSGARPIEILLVEDSPSDAELALEALRAVKVGNHVSVIEDGAAALQFLRREAAYAGAPRPDLVLLDLHLPRKDGHEVLAEMKADGNLRAIPVVILTTFGIPEDVLHAYKLNANCYIRKPVDVDQFLEVVKAIEAFWLYVVCLPGQSGSVANAHAG